MKLREAPKRRGDGGDLPEVGDGAATRASTHRAEAAVGLVDRVLWAAYRRLGRHYLPAMVFGFALVLVPGGSEFANWIHGSHLLPGASRTVLWIEIHLVVTATAIVTWLRMWPTTAAVRRWWRTGRPDARAPAVWTSLSTLSRKGTVTFIVALLAIDTIGTVSMAGALNEGIRGTLSSLLGSTFLASGGMVLAYFLIELVVRPVVFDAASRLPRDFRPQARAIPFGAKVFGSLLGASWFACGLGLWIGSGDEPLAELLAPGLLVAGVTFVGVLLMTLLITRALKRPMDDLIRMSRQAGTGDFRARAPVASADEQGELTASFNQMVGDLGRVNDALNVSRARIVAASDEARRKVERDLHDGAQQHLVLAQLKLGLLEREISDDERARKIANDLRGELERGLQELRELARGIYPATLESEGLPGALSEVAERSPMDMTTDFDSAGRYTRELETAVYFCCLEAIQNATKHAGDGAQATIRLRSEGGALRFELVDDGVGFDASSTSPDGGIQHMADRLGAVGGELKVRSAPGEGTTVSGSVPIVASPSARGGDR
ncbi:MAG: histidine kinase [Actinomycetota bacterium]